MAARKQRKAPRAPFVVTIAATAAAITVLPACDMYVTHNPPGPGSTQCPVEEPALGDACGKPDLQCTYFSGGCGDVLYTCSASGTWGDGVELSCNPPPPGVCPDGVPENGTECLDLEPGKVCSYPSLEICAPGIQATCGDSSQWIVTEVVDPTCNPPPPCPPDPPEQGAPCYGGETCSYTTETSCGPMPIEASCGPDGAWEVSTIACNPPPPDACGQLQTSDECLADAGCKWYVPGCGENPLPAAGCHALTECSTESACAEGYECQVVSINPCWNSNCDACGAAVSLCQPPPTP